VRSRPILRERRRLPTASSLRCLELLAQSFVLAPQPFDLSPQRLALSLGPFCPFAQRVDLIARRGITGPIIWHGDVMPYPRKTYKYEKFGSSSI
jgi:hypothetical protein